MPITRGHGNPNWTKEETILALELYLENPEKTRSRSDERVIALSEYLRSLPYHATEARKLSFRNSDGVAFKLQNIRQVATGKGLGNFSEMDKLVWEELGHQPERVAALAALIRAAVKVISNAEESEVDEEFVEGRLVTEAHKRRERNPNLRGKFLSARKKKGELTCEICERKAHPGIWGDAIFEVHHLVPLSVGEEGRTKLSDLALLCANCHRMLHRFISQEKRWLMIVDAKQLLFGNPVLAGIQ